MISRSANTKEIAIDIVGSSVFGRYPKISTQKTVNMFISENFLVPYAGYQIAVTSQTLGQGVIGKEGRGVFSSIKFDGMITVVDDSVFLVRVTYDQITHEINSTTVIFLGSLQTSDGIVYITENNAPQVCISDSQYLYIYDPTQTPMFQVVTGLNFVPGYITFHDNYFIAAASQDTTNGTPVNNTWRLSALNNGLSWPSTSNSVGYLQSKPDNTQAVVRFPSKGNMIFVMGSVVTEAWFDTGAQLFPYQRNNQFNIDYGCLSPATVAYMDEIVVWLAANEKSGPIIMYSNGGMPEKITTDGIDYLFAQLQKPQDSQGFLYRQDGHLFYHINFYFDNLSLYYDFNEKKFYNATDQNGDYFIAAEIAFYGNQYYFVTRNNGNLFSFDTIFTTYQDVGIYPSTTPETYIIPRKRIGKNIRLPNQDNYVLVDLGFTIESGETNYYLTYATPSGDPIYNTPFVNLSLSYDGGESFSNTIAYTLPFIGKRKNKCIWWQLGVSNDIVPQFDFVSIGRVVCTDGLAHVRT